MPAEHEILEAIRTANRAWLEGRPREVAALFHADVVMEGADGTVLARGRDAMVQSFVDYRAAVRTHAFTARDERVHVVGDTAVASYAFDVDYELDGKRHAEAGRERLVLVRGEGGWQAIWRMQTSAPRG